MKQGECPGKHLAERASEEKYFKYATVNVRFQHFQKEMHNEINWHPYLEQFKRETFNSHNNYRTLHGCPPLLWADELANTAQAWADKLAERGFLQYSENPTLGENICVVDLNDQCPKGEQVVTEWYKEINQYNYNKPGWKRGSYRFSQLLWKSTTEIGVGVSKIPGQNKAYVVVNYRPAGNNNMPGEFERNVLPPKVREKTQDSNANLSRHKITLR